MVMWIKNLVFDEDGNYLGNDGREEVTPEDMALAERMKLEADENEYLFDLTIYDDGTFYAKYWNEDILDYTFHE